MTRLLRLLLPLLLCAALATPARALTLVLDFRDPGEADSTDIFGITITTWSPTPFIRGASTFTRTDIENAVLANVDSDYHSIKNSSNSGSPLPAGFELKINFVLGNLGSAPSNGDSEYYFLQIGTTTDPTKTFLGQAGLNVARTSSGHPGGLPVGTILGTISTNNISGLIPSDPSPASLTLTEVANLIGGTTAHEMGHTLSLSHVNKTGSIQPSLLPPLMGTGAIDLPNSDRFGQREFSIYGLDGENNNATRTQIAQLITAVGLRAVPEPSSFGLALVGLAALAHGTRLRRVA